MSEKMQREYTQTAIDILRAMTAIPGQRIKDQITRMLANAQAWTTTELDQELSILFRLMDEVEMTFATVAARVIPGGFEMTSRIVREQMKRRGLAARTTRVDLKTVNVLLRDATVRYRNANNMGQASARVFFKQFSKQGRVTESDISEMLAHGLIKKQDARESLRILNRNFTDLGPRVLDEAKLAQFKDRKMAAFRKKLESNGNLSDALRAAHLEKKRLSLDGGRVLQLVNKNGDVMTFETSTYSEIVTRTKIADAQVEGTIETGEQYGVQTYRVTGHNTKTKICKPHENKVYTTATSGKLKRVFEPFNAENRPTYHPQCLHRAVAYPLTNEEIDEL